MVTFGIWPGVPDRDLQDLETRVDAPPEDVDRTVAALRDLGGGTSRFYVRCYRSYGGGHPAPPPTPLRPDPYVGEGRMVDLVAGYGSARPDPDGFARWVRAAVREVAELGGGKLQVCEEVNVPAPQDGGRPACYEALAAGLAAALDERDRCSAGVLVGFNAAATLPGDPFWPTARSRVGARALAGVDYVGLDFFPDVFRPVTAADLPGAVEFVVRSFRDGASRAGVPHGVPIHVTETGWPTGPEHSEQSQASTIGAVAETALRLADPLHVEGYELFGLRDGCSSGPRMNRFGLLRDDYTPKASYETVRELIAKHGR